MSTASQTESFQTNQFGDTYLYSVNQEDFNSLGSQAVYEQRIGESLFQENRLYFIVGSDSGLLAKYVQNKGVPTGSRYLFIEPEQLYDQIHPLAEGLNERILFSTPENALATVEEQTDLGAAYYVYLDNTEIIQSLGCRHDYAGHYAQILIRLVEELDAYRYQVQGAMNLHSHYINEIINVVDEPNSAKFLIKILTGKTAVILAGGPSLDNGLSWVKKQRKDLLVVAVSRICRQLIESEITPDIIVTTDPTQMSFDISREMLQLEGCLFTHQPGSTFFLVGQWGGMQAYFGPRLPWPTELNEKNITIGSGNTISNLAIDLAAITGVSNIVLFGVDLCYAADGHTHAQGSNERKSPPPINLNVLEVETNAGQKTETTSDLYKSALSVEEQAKAFKKVGVRLINPAPNAIKLESVEYLPLDQIPVPPMDVPAISTIRENYPDACIKEYLDRISEELKISKKHISRISTLAKRGVRILQRALDHKPSKKNPYTLAEKIRQLIDNDRMSVPTRQIAWEVFAQISLTLEGDADNKERHAHAALEYFQSCIAGCERLDKLLSEAKQRQKSRSEEIKPDPNFEIIFEQWRKDKQPGRAAIWKKNNPKQFEALDSSIKDQFAEFENEAKQQLTQEDTHHAAMLKKRTDINLALQRTINLFLEQNSEGLERLIKRLEYYPKTSAQPFINFTRGMLSELKGDQNQALMNYEPILTSDNEKLLEHTLKRISAICIEANDIENAISAIEGLTHISNQYLHDYANILCAVGYNEEAYNAYREYLGEHPNDATTLMKYGMHCLLLDKDDDAQETANKLQAIAPNTVEYQQLVNAIKHHSEGHQQ